MTRTRLLLCTGTLMLAALAACKDSSTTPTQNTNTVPKKANIRIVEFMPHPGIDSDNYSEWFRLKNLGDTAGSLIGWRIIDDEGTIWSLDTIGTLQPGTNYQLISPYRAKLNNNGDTLALFNAASEIVQTIAYGKTTEGASITIP